MLGVCKTANAGESLRASVGGSPDGGECCLLTLERPFIEGILGCGKFRFPPTDAGNLSKGFAQGCVLALELRVFQPSAPRQSLDTGAGDWSGHFRCPVGKGCLCHQMDTKVYVPLSNL